MIKSVEKAVRILQGFEDEPRQGITRIAKKHEMNKSTAFGLVSALTELGLLEHDPQTGSYRLGLELFRLGSLVDADGGEIVREELDRLAASLEETVNYVKPDGGDVVYLIKKESAHSMRICTTIGQRLPMYCTAVGKAILAFLPEDERGTIIDSYEFRAFTENTVTSKEALLADLEQAVSRGYAAEHEELEIGLVCVAVPVCGQDGRPVAALSCSGPTSRMTEEKVRQCAGTLIPCAQRLSQLAGTLV